MNIEIAARARKLVNLRGVWIADLGLGLYTYMGEFYISVNIHDELMITGRYQAHVVYEQDQPGIWGKLLYPEYADKLLDDLRRELVLDDLADV